MYALVAIAVVVFTRIEIAPRRILAQSGHKIAAWLVEVKVIVFIKQNRHWTIPRHLSSLLHHFSDPLGGFNTISVQEDKAEWRTIFSLATVPLP